MLHSFRVTDTFDKLHFRDIKDNCIVTDTHLVAIIEVTWANLFEKKEDQAIAYLKQFSFVLNQTNLPIQLITQSRPKRFDDHIIKIKKAYKDNDYKLKFPKNKEWFDIYYAHDLRNGKITQDEINYKYENSPDYIERSMLDSYIERIDTVVTENSILEKRYFFVISTLNVPKDISEKEEQNYNKINFDDQVVFNKYKNILEERTIKLGNLLQNNAWMWAKRLMDSHLLNVMFDAFNFPMSSQHKINHNYTEYWKLPPVLQWTRYLDNENLPYETKWLNKKVEQAMNMFFKKITIKYGVNDIERKKISNDTLQLVKPYSIDDSNMNYLKINDQYLYTVHIDYFWNEEFEDLALWTILTIQYSYDLSVHMIPLNKEVAMKEFKKRERRIELDFDEKIKWKSSSEAAYLEDVAVERLNKVKTIESALRNLQTNLYSISIDVTFRTENTEELIDIKELVRQRLEWKQIMYTEATWNHYAGFISTSPLLVNLLAWYNRPFPRLVKLLEEISHLYPFCPMSIQNSKGSMLWLAIQWTTEEKDKYIEFFDLFDRSRVQNSNMAIIWNSWSWKTTFAHWFIKNQILLWHRFLILDFLWNYIRWADHIKEKVNVIKIDPTSKDKINPCDLLIPPNSTFEESESYMWLSEDDIKEKLVNDKIAELSAYFRIFLWDNYDPIIRGILDKAAKNVYMRVIKKMDIMKEKLYKKIFLSDIVEEVNNEKDKDKKQRAKDIVSMLEPYSSWSFSWMFNSETNVKLDDRSVVFYLRWNKTSLYEEIATLQTFIIIKQLVFSSSNNILLIDELHKIFRMESREISNFFRSQIAMIRNLKWWVIWMTQLLKQVKWTSAWDEFLEMSVTKMYLAWGQTEWKDDTDIAKFDTSLSDSSKTYLAMNNRPWYCILKIWTQQIQVQITNHADLSLYESYSPPMDW